MGTQISRDSWYVDVRVTRKELGITQQELSGRTDIRQARISEIENGQVDPKISEVIAISEALELTVGVFPSRYLESVELAIDVCVRVEERKIRPPTIPEMILGDRAYLD